MKSILSWNIINEDKFLASISVKIVNIQSDMQCWSIELCIWCALGNNWDSEKK